MASPVWAGSRWRAARAGWAVSALRARIAYA